MFTYNNYKGTLPVSLVHTDGGYVNSLSNLHFSTTGLVRSRTNFWIQIKLGNGVQRTIINVGISLEIAELILVTPHTIEMGLHCQPHYRPTRCFSSSFSR
jgi:hypothetical protein